MRKSARALKSFLLKNAPLRDAAPLDRAGCRRSGSDYLLLIRFEDAPEHAERIVRTLYHAAPSLVEFPYRGRPGRKEGTQELLLLPLPYVIVYNVQADIIHIVRILHAAQNWP